MPEYGLVAEGVVKLYRDRKYGDVLALNEFDLTAEPGEIVGLVGANGSGKTTFVEAVIGLVRPNRGSIRVCGVDMTRQPRVGRGRLGFAPQESAMYVSATVRENLHVFGGLVGLKKQALRASVEEATDAMRLDGLMDRPVGWLSGGQRRRVQVATALLGVPDLLLLDEPTAGADPPTRQALLAAVRARAAAGAAIVYTTHYLPELADLDATLAVVKAGQVVARGDQKELLADLPGEVRLEFDGPVPDQLARQGRLEDGQLRLSTKDPGQTLAGVLAAGHVPVSVDVQRPGLDDLYTSLEAVPAHVN
jgi:ABC-2 type transport system ATP-binding protein